MVNLSHIPFCSRSNINSLFLRQFYFLIRKFNIILNQWPVIRDSCVKTQRKDTGSEDGINENQSLRISKWAFRVGRNNQRRRTSATFRPEPNVSYILSSSPNLSTFRKHYTIKCYVPQIMFSNSFPFLQEVLAFHSLHMFL